MTQPLWKHQKETLALLKKSPRVLDFSDPGTGKTRVHLEAFAERRKRGGGKAVVTCPKTLMRSAWMDDLMKYTPGMNAVLAYAEERKEMFDLAKSKQVDILIVNTDGVKALAKEPASFWTTFDTWIDDEHNAFKHRTSARSKAAAKIARYFYYRAGLTGTPNPNSVTELWHQVLLIDDGKRLGQNFYKFQSECCIPEQVGPRPEMRRWIDREGIEDVVAHLLKDITVRHEFDKCMDIPPNTVRTVHYKPSTKLLKAYKTLEHDAVLELKGKNVTAVHAASLKQKLLQIASGAVYHRTEESDSHYSVVDNERYELIGELVEEIPQPSVVFFNWTHQRDGLMKEMESRDLSYGVIDGSTPQSRREDLVEQYQAGKLRVLLMHPKTGAHGLTLTAGRRTILSSPFYEADYFKQAIHRVHRGGQKHKTETILVEAGGTIENAVYARLMEKGKRMNDLLTIIQEANS